MALISIEPANSMGFPLPLALGQTTVSATEIANELKSRGYIRGYAPTVAPTVAPTTVPTISRTDAIRAAVTKALSTYRYSSRCTTAGGCYISPARFDTIVTYARQLANYYLARGSISGLSGMLGQLPDQAVPPDGGFTSGEMIAWGIKALAMLAGQGADFYLALQQRKQWQAMGYQIPQYTATQMEAVIRQYMAANPGANEAQMRQIAQGALTGESKTPDWLLPVIIAGVGLMVVIGMRK